MSERQLILASASPRRYGLLKRCGVDFSVRTSEAEELSGADDLYLLPQQNALLKAMAVADRFPDAWVIGADTMIIFENRAIGKPTDLTEAAAMLQDFSGRSHDVVTGVALICRNLDIYEVWHETSSVKFKKISGQIIQDYLAQVPVLDKAGAYAIQEYGDLIVESFSGELENIIGLPLKKLQTLLTKYAIGGKF